MIGNSEGDLPRLALALEYGDLAAALYLAGGSDHAALLLATAGERQLGALFQLNGTRTLSTSVPELLQGLAQHRQSAPNIHVRGHAQARSTQQALARVGELGGLAHSKAREDTAGLLRASWYLLETMGLEAVAPKRLRQAIERSTIHSQNGG